MSSQISLIPHPELKGKHALFSPSQSAWLRYDEEKLVDKIRNQYRTTLGTEIHEYAAGEIDLRHKQSSVKTITQSIESFIFHKYKDLEMEEYGMKLIRHLDFIPKEVFETVKYYINDGVGYKMLTEWTFKYSDNVFGTADTWIFRDNLLRIHDLKTGSHEAKMEQLEGYAALFCYEYDIKPSEIEYELRLYQLDGIVIHKPTVEDILPIMDSIATADKIAYHVEKENK